MSMVHSKNKLHTGLNASYYSNNNGGIKSPQLGTEAILKGNHQSELNN